MLWWAGKSWWCEEEEEEEELLGVVAAAAAVELNSGYVDFFRLDVTFLVFDFFDAL